MNIEEPILFDDLVTFDEDVITDDEPVKSTPIYDDSEPEPEFTDDDTDEPVVTDDEPLVVATSDDDDHNVEGYFNFLKEYGIIDTPEDFEFDGTVDGFNKALEVSKKTLQDKVASSLWERLPEDFKPLLSYALNGGTDVRKYLDAYAADDLNNIDLEDLATQRRVVERYYQETSTHPQDRINRIVAKLEERGDLYDEAADAVEVLKEVQAKKKEQLIEAAKQEQLQKQQAAEQEYELINSSIDKAEYLDDTRKKKLKSFVLAPIRQEDRTTTQFDQALSQIFSNSEHFIQLADIIAEYDAKQGFNFDRMKRKLKTENTKAFKTLLDQTFSNKPKGTSRKPIQEDFN